MTERALSCKILNAACLASEDLDEETNSLKKRQNVADYKQLHHIAVCDEHCNILYWTVDNAIVTLARRAWLLALQ